MTGFFEVLRAELKTAGVSVTTAQGNLGRWLKLLAPAWVESMALAALKDEVKPR